MSTPYSAIETDVQGNIETEECELLTEDQVVTPDSLNFNRSPRYETPKDVKQAILQEWLTGCYDAKSACYWLRTFKLLRLTSAADPYEVMSKAAKAEFPGQPLPERVSAPIPRGYANPDLVSALAPARAQGGR